MEVRNVILAVLMALIPVIAGASVDYDKAEECRENWANGKIVMPTSQTCVKTSVDKNFVSDNINNIITVSRGSFGVSARRKDKSSAIWGYLLEESVFAKVKVKDRDEVFFTVVKDHKIADVTYYFKQTTEELKKVVPSINYYLSYDEIKKGCSDKGLSMDDYPEGKITFEVVTRFVVYRADEQDIKNNRDDVQSTVKHSSCTTKFFTCKPGEIGVDERVNPAISNGMYAIYPDEKGDLVKIVNEKYPGAYETTTQYYTWKLVLEDDLSDNLNAGVINNSVINQTISKDNIEGQLSKEKTYQYHNFEKNSSGNGNTLQAWASIAAFRSVSLMSSAETGGYGCRTPGVFFEVLPVAYFSKEQDKKIYVCPTQAEIKDEDGEGPEYDNEKEWLHIEGDKAKFKDFRNGGEETQNVAKRNLLDIYGLNYGWEYRVNGSSWRKMSDYDGDGYITPGMNYNYTKKCKGLPLSDMVVPLNMFKEGNTYDFRQIAYVDGFGGRKIESENIITVKTYNVIRKEEFATEPIASECANGDVVEVDLKSVFIPTEKAQYKPVDSKNRLQYTYTFLGETQTAKGDTLSVKLRAISTEAETRYATIEVTDGCGTKVELKDSIKFESQPVLDPSSVTCTNAEYRVADGNVQINIPSGVRGYIKISNTDPDFATSKYLYSTDDSDYKEISSHGLEINLLKESEKRYYIKKKNNYGNKCESQSVEVSVSKIEAVGNNHIYDTLYYACEGSKNPRITASTPNGGFANSQYTYMWLYSNNNVTYSRILDKNKEIITTQNLEESAWMEPINRKYYIKRVATSKSGNGALSDTSSAVVVMPYKEPLVTLVPDTNYICYGEEVRLKAKLDAEFVEQTEKGGIKMNFWYATKNADNEFESVSPKQKDMSYPSEFKYTITKDIVLYAMAEVCGKAYPSEGKKITSGENLEPKMTEGGCKVRGMKMTVNVANANPQYTYHINDNEGDAADIDVPERIGDNLIYTVKVNNGKCSNTYKKVVNENELQEAFVHNPITVGDTETDMICAGEKNTFKSTADVNKSANKYLWKNGINTIEESDTKNLTYTLVKPGMEYTLIRLSKQMNGTEVCQSIYDTLRISTYPQVERAKISVEKNIVCHGDSLNLTISGFAGATNSIFNYTIFNDDQEIISDKATPEDEKTHKIKLGADGIHEVYAMVSDAQGCINENYQTSTATKTLTQAANAEFKLAVTPSIWIPANEKSAKTFSVTATPKNAKDDMSEDLLTHSYGGGPESTSTGETFSIIAKTENFTDGNLVVNVTRQVDATGCTAKGHISISLSSGFVDRPSIKSDGYGDGDKAEVCGGSPVTLKLSTIPLFGSQTIDADDASLSYAWYGNQQLKAKTPTYQAVASAGDTVVYQCKLIYKNSKMTEASSVYSYDFTLIGKKGVKLGNVYRSEDKSRYAYTCVGSEKEITLEVDADFESGDKIVWEQSEDGVAWAEVNEKNIVDKSETRLTLDGGSYSSAIGKTYFRVKGTSDCGTVTYSKNNVVLTVQAVPETPVVALRSRNVIETGTDVSLAFSPKNSYAGYRFEWGIEEDDNSKSTIGSAEATFTGKFNIGENRIYVRKIATTDGMCASALTAFDFNLYEELSIGLLIGNKIEKPRCPKDNEVTLHVGNIKGGSGKYVIVWQYKGESGHWISFDENSMTPFSATYVEGAFGNNYQYGLDLTGLTSSMTFRAKIASVDEDGNYIGDFLATNEHELNFYDELQDEGIDTEEVTLCYGETVGKISGSQPKGGNGNYAYQWYKTTTPTEESSWKTIAAATLQNYSERDTLVETTYYKRTVRDGCGIKLESVSKRVGVSDAVEIKDADVKYTSVVLDGNDASMWGVPNGTSDASQYVWYDENWLSLDTTELTEPYKKALTVVEENLQNQTFVYYAKKYLGGCLSYNSDTLYITASKNTSGSIFINAENEDNFWVCSGTTDIEILSENNPFNAKGYSWHYRITEYNADADELVPGNWLNVVGTNEAFATGENINLDTCRLENALRNVTGRKKYIELRRTPIFEVSGIKGDLTSNVVRINIVPIMSTIPLSEGSIAGTISSNKVNYCKGDNAESVVGSEKNMSSNVLDIWSNPEYYFGPGLYDKEYNGGIYTWFEYSFDRNNYDTVSIFNSVENNKFASSYIPGEGFEKVMNHTWYVRRGVSDGCTRVYTNVLALTVNDDAAHLSSILMYGYESGKTGVSDRIKKGFELGDSLVIGDNTTELFEYRWSLDSLFRDTFATSMRSVGFTIEENAAVRLMQDPNVYVKRKSNGCWSSYLQIPVAFGTASKGGRISESQKVCFGADFGGIGNVEKASGEWISPNYAEMKWSYSWQWSQDSVKWGAVENANGISLSAELVNKYVDPFNLKSGKTTYFRRVATNDSSRVRYSNVAALSYYEEMKPGVLSDDNNGKIGYCADEPLPVITTTEPTGGRFYDFGVGYVWKIAINGGEYNELPIRRADLDLMFVDTISKLSLDNIVKVSVICEYTDGENGCGFVQSEPLDYTLYRRNDAPGIYQDNDSCDAQTVVVKVVPEKTAKTYFFGTFVFTENGDSLTWESEATEKTIKRVTTMIVDQYGVYSIDNATGCHSEYTKFNVDSLPDLSQDSLVAPSAVCYGEDYTVKGGNVAGGNGVKTFTWQYSYDEVEWETVSNQPYEDLDVIKPKKGISYRRIVSDMCGADTSNAVRIEVREKIDVTKDAFVLNDFKCEGRMFNINTAEGVVFTETDYYLVWDAATGDTFDTKGMTRQTMDGFEGDSLEMGMIHVIVDATGMACKSETIKMYAHNAVAMDHESNRISCDNTAPCNERYVEIEGESQGGAYADKIGYKWYVSPDNANWTEQLLKTGMNLSLQVADTMYIRRTAYNGCVYDTSNVVTVIGTKVEQYDYVGALTLEVASNMQDSSVSMSIDRGKEFASNYFIEGDGELPQVTGNMTLLPYKAEDYRDSIVTLVANSDHCVSSYRINPLRGGVISFDGDSVLCGGGEIPAIVATLVEGGNGDYSYQWQYKNTYTADFVDIEGATDKEYTPKAVSVETSYRRKTKDGEYTSLSNVISVNIRPLPKAAGIVPSVSDSVLKSYNLKTTQFSVEKLPSMTISLIDTISDADAVIWQKSYDNAAWEDVERLDANTHGVYEMTVEDSTDIVYYRTVATSTCGEHTGKSYKVSTLYASVIMDDELVLKDSVCKGDASVFIKYKKDYPNEYEYTYRTIGFEGKGPYAFTKGGTSSVYTKKEKLTDTTKVSYGATFLYPEHSFDVEVTRMAKSTGASSTKLIHFYVDELSAKFSYIVDGVESHESGEKSKTVRLNQGSRVVFTPEAIGGLEEKSYKWNLIEPLNVKYYETYGGSAGRDGLTSEKESPVCYFYNKGSYPITLQVTDGVCTATVSDTAMYIAEATRAYLRSASFDEEVYEFESIKSVVELGVVEVIPTHFSDQFTIYTDYREAQHYELYNSLGTKVKEGDCLGSVVVETDDLIPGYYVFRMAGKVIGLVKSK